MKKKVVVQLVDSLNLGGTERMSVNLANTFHRQGWESHLIVSRKSGGLQSYLDPDVKVYFLEKKNFMDLGALQKLFGLLRTIKPDYVHAHSTSIYWGVLLKIFAKPFMLIWHDHFGLSDQLESNKRKEMLFFSRWIDRIVVVNQKLSDFWKSVLPKKQNAIAYLTNFPYLDIDDTLEKFEVFTFLNLANYRPQKDQLTLIEAAKRLSNENLDFQVLLVGQHVDAEWEEQIRRKIEEEGISSKVKVYGPSDQVATLLARSHVGILSSTSEGLPVALLEYGLAALPSISTSVGQCAEVLGDGEFGILVPPSDPEAMANSMAKMMNNPDNLLQFGKKLQHQVKCRYGEGQFISAYKEFLK